MNMRNLRSIPLKYPQGESNAYRRNRNPKFYPLNYGGMIPGANILNFCIFADAKRQLDMKRAYVFPGQGSQFPGMARDLYEGSPAARDIMERANEVLGFRITDIMFDGTDEELKATEVTQPAVFLHSVCAASAPVPPTPDSASDPCPLQAPDMVGGHSLGEFSALVISGAVRFEDALRLVAIRAREMQKCCEAVSGTMAAVIGLPDEVVEEVCAKIPGLVIPANYNSPGQVVISGELEAVAAASAGLKAAGARRVLPLQVSGAFHSPLMEPARAALAVAIEQTEVSAPLCPIYQNVTAVAETDPLRIKANLLAQLTSPVRWSQSVRAMVADGAGEFTEFGPGTVLQGLVRRTCPDIIFK